MDCWMGSQRTMPRFRGLLKVRTRCWTLIAAGLYSLASMLVGEGEDSVRLVETAVATAEISACHDAKQARTNSRRALCCGGD